MSRIFDVIKSMSGQGNSITIPVPYVDFFAGDQQPHVLGAILNQLVFWSGKSDLNDGWFYKEHAELASEIHGVSPHQVYRLVKKIRHLLPGVIEVEQRQVNGTKKTHYRIDGEALIGLIFPELQGITESRNGNHEIVKPVSRDRETHIAESRDPNHEIVKPILYTDQYTDLNKQIKDPSSENSGESSDASSEKEFLKVHPEAVVYSPKGSKWGNEEDLRCAKWIWSRIIRLYEQAAETDGELVSPKEPNWTVWANEVRMMRMLDNRNHRHICELFGRANKDRFWCKNILSPAKLREKWDELVLKLPAANTGTSARSITPPTGQTPPGFMSAAEFVAQHPIPDGAFDDDD
ncbi:replication protein 15 [Sodalis ligni]|uniref:Uncharacterized protein n=1 Tax=Sodalis ligni TaxID=2697027 RepID=A0A4R1NGN0_9GAMM|nr:replication protein 15 [Sodalis ligni]TCL06864.1 hypothetical protein EZJ58_5161 [Sodalis ligni]